METVLARLKASLNDLPPTARRIASIIIGKPDRVIRMSVSELAAEAGSSEGSVIALCRQLMHRGFADLKIALAQEIAVGRSLLHEDVVSSDDAATVARKIASSHAAAIEDTLRVLDAKDVDRAATIIAAARRVEFYGVGTAAPIADDAAYRFLRIGLDSRSVTDSHMQAVAAGMADPDVATVTISHSGRTRETILSTRLAREAGARTIGITNFGRSPLQSHCEVVLFTAAQETKYRMEALSSRVAQMVVIDVLYARLATLRWTDSLSAIEKSYGIIALKRIKASDEPSR